ncbi:MAG: hypothetical protein Q8Q73_19310 [Stagnimonas sp.]|nr:hypothetical protein [Stagnimonas sp.]
MSRPVRAAVLILVLLLQGLGSVLALPPALPSPLPQAAMAMPCHEAAETAAEDQAAMPCCDDEADCRCDSGCFGAASALVSSLAAPGGRTRVQFGGSTPPPALAPAHPQQLLRPPASSES